MYTLRAALCGMLLVLALSNLGHAQTNTPIADAGLSQAVGLWSNAKLIVVGGTPPNASSSTIPAPLYTVSPGVKRSTTTTDFVSSLGAFTAPSTTLPRLIGHAACVISDDGTVLLFGGFVYPSTPFIAGQISADTATYAPLTATLPAQTGSNATGTAPTSRIEASLTRVGNEGFLLGGYDGSGSNGVGIRSVYRDFRSISPANPTGTVLPTPPQGWWQHTATLTNTATLIILGGVRDDGTLQPMNLANIYDTGSKTWSVQSLTGVPPSPRRNHVAVSATISGSQSILVHGGTDLPGTAFLADMFTLSTDTWSWSPITPSNPIPGRHGHIAINTLDDRDQIIAIGLGNIAPGSSSPGQINYLSLSLMTFVTSISAPPANTAATSGKVIAIGVACGVVVVACIVAFIIYRNRVKRAQRIRDREKGSPSWQWGTGNNSSLSRSGHALSSMSAHTSSHK